MSLCIGGNGLFDACVGTEAMDINDIKLEVLTMISSHCPKKSCSLAGFSVHCDREILHREMPEIYDYMSHQIIDVSTILTLSSKWIPTKLIGRPNNTAGSAHRAMADVLYSIETLRFCRGQFFI